MAQGVKTQNTDVCKIVPFGADWEGDTGFLIKLKCVHWQLNYIFGFNQTKFCIMGW